MIRIKLTDGSIVEGRDAAQVVKRMRDSSFIGASQTIGEFMRGYAKRSKLMSGADIRTGTEEYFLQDAIAAGSCELVTEV